MNVNRELRAVGGLEEMYLDGGQEDTGGSQSDLSWRDTAAILRHSENLDDTIQR